MTSSLLPLKLKIITGYVVLVLLFLVLLAFIYRENLQLSVIDKRAEKALAQREQAETITLQILDIAQLSEQMIAWNEKDIVVYTEKLNQIKVLLQELQKQIFDKSQRNRITSILALLSAKNAYTLAIVKDLKKFQTTHELLNRRIPTIIQQTKQDRLHIAEQIKDNYGKNEKMSSGFLGLFRNKKKIHEQAEMGYETILQKNHTRSDTLLRSLTNEMQLTRDKQNKQLSTHMDSLNKKSAYLNNEINRLITEFNIVEQAQMKEKTEAYLLGQEKALQLVSCMGIGAMLLAIVLYLILRQDLKKRYHYRILLENLNHNNEELLRARKSMMLTVSHDLRAPLTAIRGCTELLIDERYKEKRTQLCETILQSSDSMTILLNTLLNFYRLDTGKEQPNCAPFRIKSLTDTLTAEFNTIAHKVGLIFSTKCIGGDTVVMGDRDRLIQITGNLLSNAIKFTSSGEVQLRLCYQEGILTIEVSDTGTGMTPEQIGLIFKPFERLENAETKEGFGLGLAIAQGLTALLNGKIEVKSEIGKGSTFSVLIPLSIAEEHHFTQEVAPPCSLPVGLRILAIDDDAVLLAMTREMLTRSLIRCDICHDVQELTEKMREREYDLLITDIKMSQMSGFDLLELLRTSDIRTSRTIPVLAVTARVDFERADFIAAGFAGYLYKPFSIMELVSAVQSCVGEHGNEFSFQANFSELLSSEQNGKEMLELLIRETEKNMETLMESVKKENYPATTLLIHHLLPLWEIVQADISLRKLCQVLAQGNGMKDEKVLNAVDRVIATGKQLTMQAAEKIKEEGYE